MPTPGRPWEFSDRAARLPANWRTEIRPRVLARDNHQCRLRLQGCTLVATEVDHIERGDLHIDENLQAACSHCHGLKTSAEGNAARPRLNRPPEQHPALA